MQSLAGAAPAADPFLEVLRAELTRAKTDLGKAQPPPYFISYSVLDQHLLGIVASEGALTAASNLHTRTADVSLRVGTSELDNTHGKSRHSGLSSGALPLDGDPGATSRILWRLTDREYQQAARALLNVKAEEAVRTKEDDDSPDFSGDPAEVRLDATAAAAPFDQQALSELARKASAEFRKYPGVMYSIVTLQAQHDLRYFISSQGSQSRRPETWLRLMLQAQTQADDGMVLMRVETFLAPSADKLPPFTELTAKIARMASDLAELKRAPTAEPYSGPALLSGRAAAVFFHEVLGHRLEGQRQRGDEEGQTFAKRVGQLVLPKFLSVVDDPTLRQLAGVDLAGWYDTDEEGEPAERVTLIEDGILKNFLMSRLPVTGFVHSNGHGRAQQGFLPVGRQGNLLVESSQHLSESDLRQRFIAEIKKQGKPYGLYFEDIEGGFTLTQRALPQAFQVLPVMVWKVYADGRPDELVRGVDIVGTPLTALSSILATGDQQYVFNGICGAESGDIPVSAAAPAMLFSEIEVQRKQQTHGRTPILPPPPLPSASGVAQ